MAIAKTLKVENGDIVRYTKGTGYYQVTKKEKCRQDVKCALTTDIRASTGIGAGLDNAIGSDIENPATSYSIVPLGFDFQNRVSNCLNRLIRAQKRYLPGFRPNSEMIADFSPVKMWREFGDSRSFNWGVAIHTIDGRSNFSIAGTFQGQ